MRVQLKSQIFEMSKDEFAKLKEGYCTTIKCEACPYHNRYSDTNDCNRTALKSMEFELEELE